MKAALFAASLWSDLRLSSTACRSRAILALSILTGVSGCHTDTSVSIAWFCTKAWSPMNLTAPFLLLGWSSVGYLRHTPIGGGESIRIPCALQKLISSIRQSTIVQPLHQLSPERFRSEASTCHRLVGDSATAPACSLVAPSSALSHRWLDKAQANS